MSRISARLVAAGAAAVLSLTALSGAAAADTAPVTATGNAVINESNTFLQSAAGNGVVIIPLPQATPSYDSTTGFSASFPVAGASVNLAGYYGNVQLGGSLLFIDFATGKSVTFKQIAFSADDWRVTGVPAGGTTPVPLLKPAGVVRTTKSGTTQTLSASDLKVDANGAQFLDTQLNTTFFTSGQSVGSLSLTVVNG
ncbi:hypothetical protein [Kitasatospora sp. SUK 42]|uniref:hypothetical protein n=1 Tax=Kitasatospora sp. SUK 42 TaxID=1588882 RepID=UPI0018CBDDB1|nr:hypothetical protein [Kitasatospora sp. SUK 42]MBV2152721.1 hypothetical protein [Kitasatospora sp. SUK 42]